MNNQTEHTNYPTAMALFLAALILGTPQLANTETTPTPEPAAPTIACPTQQPA
ncbi:hypothetical protein [Streptomyces sp. NBRC 109706]|uniref:hypothetical protein n=1 Tax=Streptomyces sp. NBRC 109706 TaxID=1550035 RepID=UPI000AD8325E|nr:hypothetical protein [Streptomyces sp. NBRC 109706]